MKKLLIIAAIVSPVTAGAYSGFTFKLSKTNCVSGSTSITGNAEVGCACSSDAHYGSAILYCECAGQSKLYNGEGCVEGSYIDGDACEITGSGTPSATYCFPYNSYDEADLANHDPCSLCGCENKTTYGAWESKGNHVVMRKVYSGFRNYNSYMCTASGDVQVEYGCEAGYYQSGGSGSYISCTACPSSGGIAGKSNVGNTLITGCYIPANTTMTDVSGTSVFTKACHYTK